MMNSLTQENTPEILKQEKVLCYLSNTQFERFIEACNKTTEKKPSEHILKAAQRLDEEGF